jgi:CHASE1-domain containing sensor protein
MVGKIDTTEALVQVNYSSILILILIFILLAGIFIIGLVFWQRNKRRNLQQLLIQREAFESQRDVYLARIEHLNKVLQAIRNINQLITREKDAT